MTAKHELQLVVNVTAATDDLTIQTFDALIGIVEAQIRALQAQLDSLRDARLVALNGEADQ